MKQLLVTRVLSRELYDELCPLRTPRGISIDSLIRGAVDWSEFYDTGHSSGAHVGDPDCYDTFRQLLEPLLELLAHPDSPRVPTFPASRAAPASGAGASPPPAPVASVMAVKQPLPRFDPSAVLDALALLDGDSDRVLATTLRARRSVDGFCLPSCMGRSERQEVEKLLSSICVQLEGCLAGAYSPAPGSQTWTSMPGGADKATTAGLREDGWMPTAGQQTARALRGLERDFSHGRGVFQSSTKTVAVLVNGSDHAEFALSEKGADVRSLVDSLKFLLDGVESGLEARNSGFVYSNRWGHLVSDPADVGTGLRCILTVRAPAVKRMDGATLEEWLAPRGLRLEPGPPVGAAALAAAATEGVLHVSNRYALGLDEVALVSGVIRGVVALIDLDHELVEAEGLLGAGRRHRIDQQSRGIALVKALKQGLNGRVGHEEVVDRGLDQHDGLRLGGDLPKALGLRLGGDFPEALVPVRQHHLKRHCRDPGST
ncbi:hypothetical protein T492DRAFT_838053 [Pavlovales sp. CCMP2436]|nr:hypothetical protein T492DRAFT_838053 [Pavlovales sp. CCMP2436]